jgi:hypothetical protein
VFIGFKCETALKGELEASAEIEERSLSAETRERVKMTFRNEAATDLLMTSALDSEEAWALGELLARAMSDAGTTVARLNGLGEPSTVWFDDPVAYHHATVAVLRILKQCRPPGSHKPQGVLGALVGLPVGPRNLPYRIGRIVADSILQAVRGRTHGSHRWTTARRVLDRLGSIGRRLVEQPAPEAMMVAGVASDPKPTEG